MLDPKELRPMLADNDVVLCEDTYHLLDWSKPRVASAKVDGWRALRPDDVPRTRKGLALPNLATRAALSLPSLAGLDGELTCGLPTDPNSMQLAQSAFSSIKGEPEFTWWIFDDCHRGALPYWKFWQRDLSRRELPEFCRILPQVLIHNLDELRAFVKSVTDEGFEGAILRSLDSPYKRGRSTFKQGYLLKCKEYVTDEARIVELLEKETNTNAAETNDLGYAKRSSAKAGKVGADTLGSFLVESANGERFKIGTGHLDDFAKKLIWEDAKAGLDTWTGSLATYKHFAASGVRNKPRHGQFVSLRSAADLGGEFEE
jgi:ATP-dependent DNA ligase